VFFREISDVEISEYVESGEPMDKAGAYAAQGRGAVFVERIEGDFFNVMGLPLCRLAMMLKEFGVVL
jgi:septum formation protein